MRLKALMAAVMAAAVAAGCATSKKAVENAGHKSIVGDGFVTVNKITVTDTATDSYTPQLFSLFVNGRYTSLLKDTPVLYYDKKESASTFNSSAKTTEEYLLIQLKSGESMEAVIKALQGLKQQEAAK